MTCGQAGQASPLLYHYLLFTPSNTYPIKHNSSSVSTHRRATSHIASYSTLLDASWDKHQLSCLSKSIMYPCSHSDSRLHDNQFLRLDQLIAVQYIHVLVYRSLGHILLATHRICPSPHPHTGCCLLPSFHFCFPSWVPAASLQRVFWFHSMWASAACIHTYDLICMSWIWLMSIL